jgi:hypothetical protein
MTNYVIEILPEKIHGAVVEELHKVGFPPIVAVQGSAFVRDWMDGHCFETRIIAFAKRYPTEQECQENIAALRAKFPGRYRPLEVDD